MVAKVYNSFAVTISLKDQDFKGEIEEWFTSWLKKQDYSMGVVEKDSSGKLHAHAQIWNESPSRKGDMFGTAFKSKILKYSPDSVVLGNRGALNSEIAYNDRFVEYMEKDIVKELVCKLPQLTDKYYPSEEEQQKVMAEANAVDKKFHRWLLDFKESNFWINEEWVPSLGDCARFLAYQMFVSKKYPVIVEKRRRVEYTKCLYCYAVEKRAYEEFLTLEDKENYDKYLEEKHDL